MVVILKVLPTFSFLYHKLPYFLNITIQDFAVFFAPNHFFESDFISSGYLAWLFEITEIIFQFLSVQEDIASIFNLDTRTFEKCER